MNELGAESAAALAPAIAVSASLTEVLAFPLESAIAMLCFKFTHSSLPCLCAMQLNLSSNQLCGIDWRGHGTFSVEGITALAEALKVTASLTRLDVSRNLLDGRGGNGVQLIRNAVSEQEGFVLIDDNNH